METRKIITYIIGVGLLLASCVKDDLYNTAHPDKGAVVVTTDWTGRSSDAVVPGSYTLRIGTQEQSASGETNAFNALFLPGRQDLLVYHPTDGVTIGGTSGTDAGTAAVAAIATVNTLPDGTLEPLPGYLFSASGALEIVKDDTLGVTVKMRQLIRSLTLALKLKPGDEGRIGSISATLTGIASAVDLTTGIIMPTGGKTLIPAFAPGTDGGGGTRATGQPLLAATLRLLGVTAGEKQVLTLKITLTDGYVQTLTTDLTGMLKNFGSGLEPLTLDATLELPTAAGIGGTITDWNVVDNGDIKVN